MQPKDIRELNAAAGIIAAASADQLRVAMASENMSEEIKLATAIIRAAEFIKANRKATLPH